MNPNMNFDFLINNISRISSQFSQGIEHSTSEFINQNPNIYGIPQQNSNQQYNNRQPHPQQNFNNYQQQSNTYESQNPYHKVILIFINKI